MKNFHLIDWAVKEIRESGPQQRAVSEYEAKPTLNKPLEILEAVLRAELRHEENVDPPRISPQIEKGLPDPISEVVVVPSPGIACMATEPASLISTDVASDPKFSLRKAIIAPDIFTSPFDRNRAIDLRWVLRDIKGNRLKLCPAGEEDLRDLIDLGLVEMRGDAPVLTSAGDSVVS
jgi:hypothetical protein